MTKKKIMMTAMSAGLVAVVGVGGTLAYLSKQTEVVNNTFTIGTGYVPDNDGHEGIFIDETDVDNSSNGKRDIENVYKEMVPAKSYTKDPLVHMVGGSIASYVFVHVTGLEQLDEQNIHVYYYDADGELQEGVDTSDYLAIDVNKFGDGTYVYCGGEYGIEGVDHVVDVSKVKSLDVELANVFDVVKMDADVSSDEFEMVNLNDKAIQVQAAAVQYAEGMNSYTDAVSTLPEAWNVELG